MFYLLVIMGAVIGSVLGAIISRRASTPTRYWLTVIATAFLVALLAMSAFASPVPSKQCISKVKEYVTKVPEAVRILKEMSNLGEEKFFWKWAECPSVVMSVATSVHESIHFLGHHGDYYYLLNGTKTPRIKDVLTRPKMVIGRLFRKNDMYAGLYIHGEASSSDYFDSMLDELTAYTYDTKISISLKNYILKGESYRDGLSALMAFTMAYVNKVTISTKHQEVMESIWNQAEEQLASACGMKQFSVDDKLYLRFLRNSVNQKGLEKFLGRPLKIPNVCFA